MGEGCSLSKTQKALFTFLGVSYLASLVVGL